MARLRPTEVRAVMALLDDPADDLEDLARDVITAIDDLRAKRSLFTAVLWQPGFGLFVYGPYDTEKQAEKALTEHVVAAVEGARGGVRKITRPGGDVDDEV